MLFTLPNAALELAKVKTNWFLYLAMRACMSVYLCHSH